jgi:nucleotide-binding universal stress UspA family protein
MASKNNGVCSSQLIVVGIDGSPSATAALRWAVKQAQLSGGTVDAVIAWEPPAAFLGYGWSAGMMSEPAGFQEAAAKTLARAVAEGVPPDSGVPVEQKVIEGYGPRVLVEVSREADLLVVGSRGHGAFADVLLGSVSQHCSHHASCPVVIMRGADHG